MKTIKMKRQL